MAAEVPVSDVLCEAMEYLTKLGSNLRARSESLKEKRIRKDKLKNSHAVQKAADKVLLICELSKKSLENVEIGVRKVLSHLKDNQMSPAKTASSSKSHTTNKEKQYQYITLGSRKVKIAKKVPVKHYMSVRVVARNMPKSLQAKYPVYHDCKLYRKRKRLQKNLTSNSDIVDTKESIEDKFVSRGNNDNTTLDTEKSANLLSEVEANSENIVDTEFKSQSVQKPDNSGENNRSRDEKFNDDPATYKKKDKTELESSKTNTEDERTRKPKKKGLKKFRHIKIIDDSSDNSCEPKVISVDSDEGSNKKIYNDADTKSSSPVAKNNDNSSKGLIKGNAETVSESLVQANAGDKLVETEVVPESSEPNVISVDSDEESNKKKDNDADTKSSSPVAKNNDNSSKGLIKGNAETVFESLVQSNAGDNLVENEVVPESSEPKVISVDSDEESNKKKYNDADIKSSAPGAINNDNNSSEGLIKGNAKTVSESLVQENAGDNLVENEVVPESNRPFIKCVSLNKLLKPDVLKKAEVTDNLEKSPDKKKEKFKNIKKVNSIDKYLKKKGRESNDKHKKNYEVSERNSSSDEEYWSMKRKEVSNFQSKKFTVNIYRLPTLNELFLKSHNLKKIIRNNKIICEFNINENIASSSDKENNTISKESEIPIDKINSVKNDLLNESDSEKADSNGRSPVNFQEIMETVKSALLDFSVDDQHISEFEGNKRIENVKDSVDKASNNKELDCDSETSKQSDIVPRYDSESNIIRKEKNNHDTEKESLPHECDIDKNEKILKSTQKDQEENEQSSIDKVKNTLLFESGSDNNEQSNNATTKHNENNNDDSTKSSKPEDNKSSNERSNDKTSKPGENINDESAKSSKQEDHQSGTNENKDKTNSDDQLETDCSKKRKRKNSTTVKSKRKHIMESMHAKKMLLTYSSSDTEDEQLKNALKDIKDSLLKEKSSDDENARNSKVKESSASSESDDDILRKVKRAKKSNKSDVSSSEEKNSKSTDVAKASNSNNSDKGIESSDERSDSCSAKMGRSRAQPGGSSHNSDSQEANDKNIDGLTNLKSLSRRRRDSPATNSNSSSVKRTTRKMAKAPLLSEENLLKPESSSDAASASGGESEVEDLPPVTLSGLNGSGLDHLAKDDLLDESDTSASHNEKEEEHKTTESEEDHNPKSKRRKAIAISSDSEAGSSRKNKRDERDSDFEDSEDDGLESSNRSKRKKKVESDASDASSNESSKKKRRRIKQLNDSDASGSDSENEGRNKHGRKNIRKVMGKNQLEEATKKAAREEKERIARIAERQKVYNNLEFDESGKPDEVVLEKVVLDFDPETKEPLIEVDRGLVKKLKPHQANGIKFMWDACFESVKRIKKDRGSGCILAHCMGLGKTLQVVSLTHTLLTHSDLTTVNRVLVVCPLSTVLNWVNEFKMWLKFSLTDFEVDVYELSRYKQNSERAFQLQQWLQHGGVCVLGYEMFRNLSADNNKKFKKKMLKNFQEALVDPGPDMVVCDEGHLLKNEKTSLSQSMNRVRTRRRIVLTGTPLQNNLKEYYCMVQFVKPNLLGKYNEYLNRFVNPITNGQYTDSTEHDIRIMKRRSHVLHKMLDGAVQRRDYGVLAPFLPPKHEYVLFITLTEIQIKLYQYYLDNYSRRPLPGKSSGFLFPDFQSLQRIWTHPLVLKYNSERYEIMQQKKREREEEEDSEGSLVDFIDDDSTPDESTTDESSDDLSDVSDDSRKKSKKKKSSKKNKPGKESKISTRRTRANPDTVELAEAEIDNDVVEMKAENPTEWWIKLVTDDEIDDMRNSHKLVLLFDILRQCETIGDKLLVFSQSLYSLDLIEHFLGKVDEATQEGRIDEKLGGHVGSWSPGIDYFRLDGSTSCENRSIWCKNFNREDNPRARLFLISTRAGGLGINLVAANRVVIFDVSWNPSHDVQSIFRVYRFGQKKPCYVYRFLAMGTMEEKIYERQVTKQAISKRVIDEQQIDRHYAENDLAELYKFEARPPTPRPLPPLPKDRLFAEMLREHEAQIYKYHEHDSLLENKEEETLSEEERKAAWEDFENEKNRPPPAPFPTAWPMHNGMMPGLLAQQQQQLAYAALAAMLRKDMPNINDNTIRDMLPHIYNSNPAMFGGYDYGLMQKVSELYKFAPPGGMMNPGMMNPGVMNASGGGGALGGSSGLQYEPPWQRQHQQQQQMRLQQLLQHQNAQQMGAKYYAGGLGSRDPVAMAMQQQRAREIMAGDTRSRPRGRPPLQPRAPPPAHADVVNLDSD